MWYVYKEYVNGKPNQNKTQLLKICDSHEDAICYLAKCYAIDRGVMQLGTDYYYMVLRCGL